MDRNVMSRRHLLGAGAASVAGVALATALPTGAGADAATDSAIASLNPAAALNVATFKTVVDRGLNHGDLTVIDEFVSPAMVDHQNYGPGYPPGRDGLKALIRSLRTAIPDLHSTVVDAYGVSDRMFGRAVTQGTFTGPYLRVPPTGAPIGTPHPELAAVLPGPNGTLGLDVQDEFRFEQLSFLQLRRGQRPKMVEHWGVADFLTLLAQMAIIQFTQFAVYTGPFPPV